MATNETAFNSGVADGTEVVRDSWRARRAECDRLTTADVEVWFGADQCEPDEGLINGCSGDVLREVLGLTEEEEQEREDAWRAALKAYNEGYRTGARREIRSILEIAPCQCGEQSGVTCECEVAAADAVIVEWMPMALRASHTEARNRGVYPHNGAMLLRVSPECADAILETDGEWACKVEA